MTALPTIDDIQMARKTIEPFVHQTPLVPSNTLSRLTGAQVKLKLECFQDTRAFKVRGAANAILDHPDLTTEAKGLVTFSTGNHGRATAYVAARLGIPAVICMSNMTTIDKRDALKKAGAEIRLIGDSQDEARGLAIELAEAGLTFVDPINNPSSTAGHGTIGLELIEDWPDIDTVVVPVSGGALASGIAVALQALAPNVRVIAVSMDRGAAMYQSLQAGRPIQVPEVDSLADCLQGGITLENTHTFQLVRDLIDDFVLVTEEEIALAMTEALLEENLVLEGAGATPIAAVMFANRERFGDRIALLATGGNVRAGTVIELATDHADDLGRVLGSRS